MFPFFVSPFFRGAHILGTWVRGMQQGPGWGLYDGAAAGRRAVVEAAEQASRASVPVLARLPKFWYQEDRRHMPGILQLKGVRAVNVTRKFLGQLTVHNAPFGDAQTRQEQLHADNDIFFFLEEIERPHRVKGGGLCACEGRPFSKGVADACSEPGVHRIRGFTKNDVWENRRDRRGRVTRELIGYLREVDDPAIVDRSWREFQQSPAMQCAGETGVISNMSDWEFLGVNHADRNKRKREREKAKLLCTRLDGKTLEWLRLGLSQKVHVPCISNLVSYCTTGESYSGGGEMVFSGSCSLFNVRTVLHHMAPAWHVIPNYSPPSMPASSMALGACSMHDFIRIVDNDGADHRGTYLQWITHARRESIRVLLKNSIVVCSLLDGRTFRFKEDSMSLPLQKMERQGITHRHGVCVDETDLVCPDEDGMEGACGRHTRRKLGACYCRGLRYSDAGQIHNDVVPSPVMALERAFRPWEEYPRKDGKPARA